MFALYAEIKSDVIHGEGTFHKLHYFTKPGLRTPPPIFSAQGFQPGGKGFVEQGDFQKLISDWRVRSLCEAAQRKLRTGRSVHALQDCTGTLHKKGSH